MSLLISLTGSIRVEGPNRSVQESALGGRQVRLAFAFLVAERHKRVSRHAVADLLWPGQLPRSWEPALRGVMSKVRRALVAAGVSSPDVLTAAFGCYQLHLPFETVVDIEAAAAAVSAAEDALVARKFGDAIDQALGARTILTKPFLPGEDGDWPEAQRRELETMLLRALNALSTARVGRREFTLAVEAAEEAVTLAPLREASHRCIMAAHAGGGNRAEALRAYERCRRVLAEELGVDPSAETEAAYVDLLRAEADPGLVKDCSPVAPPPVILPLQVQERCGELIGRERELARLASVWRSVTSGQRKVVQLVGEACMGKTALALEWASIVQGQGGSVLYGRCDRSSPPYQPFAEVFCRCLLERRFEDLAGTISRTVAEGLAYLVPDAFGTYAPPLPSPGVDGEFERHRLISRRPRSCGRWPTPPRPC